MNFETSRTMIWREKRFRKCGNGSRDKMWDWQGGAGKVWTREPVLVSWLSALLQFWAQATCNSCDDDVKTVNFEFMSVSKACFCGRRKYSTGTKGDKGSASNHCWKRPHCIWLSLRFLHSLKKPERTENKSQSYIAHWRSLTTLASSMLIWALMQYISAVVLGPLDIFSVSAMWNRISRAVLM